MPNSDRQRAYLYFAISAGIIGLILIGRLALKPPAVDGETGCTEKIENKTVFLIDHTEGIPEQTRREIIARSTKYILDDTMVKEGDLVSIFFLTELSKNNLVPAFMRCKPRKEGNAATEDAKKIRKEFETKFLTPVRDLLEGPIPTSPQSPVGQAIIDLSLSDQLRGAPNANLIIFSDLIENSDSFSMYHCPADAIAQWNVLRIGAVARPTFTNVRVQAHVIPRRYLSKESITCRDKFWVWFFGDNAGPKASFTPDDLPG